MNKNPLGKAAVILLVVCALVVFWPSADPSLRYTSVTTYHVTQDQLVPANKAIQEADAIVQEAQRLSDNGELTPDRMFALQKRMKYLDVYAEHRGPNPKCCVYFEGMRFMTRLANIRDSDRSYLKSTSEELECYRNLFETDPEWLALEKFRVSTTVDNKWEVFHYRFLRYLATTPLGMLACILLMMWLEHLSFGYALTRMLNHPFMVLFYPIGALWVLVGIAYRRHEEEVRHLKSVVSYTIAGCLSLFAGTASAQTVKKEDKRKTSGITLQLDNRLIVPVEGPPPTVFNRTTLNTKNWVADSISTFTPSTSAWTNEVGGGFKVVRTAQTVSAVGIVSHDSRGVRKIMFGAQYFRPGPRSMIAVPVARVEKTIGGPTALAVVANPIFRLGRQGAWLRWALSPDVTVRKTFGRPLSWNAGLGLDYFVRKGKGDRVEAALFKNSSDQWQVRGRYVLNFAF